MQIINKGEIWEVRWNDVTTLTALVLSDVREIRRDVPEYMVLPMYLDGFSGQSDPLDWFIGTEDNMFVGEIDNIRAIPATSLVRRVDIVKNVSLIIDGIRELYVKFLDGDLKRSKETQLRRNENVTMWQQVSSPLYNF